MNESDLQKKIVKLLTKAEWYVLKVVICNKSGHPDITAFKNGKTVFIEVKKPGKEKIDPLQELRRKQLRKLGFPFYVVNNLGDTKKIIERHDNNSI